MTLELPSKKILYPVTEYLPKLQDNLEARTMVPEMALNTLPELNEKIWGLQRGKFYIIAARPGIGKSAFVLQIAYDIGMQDRRVLFLSLEMTVEDLLERLFCRAHSIDNQQLLRGNFNNHRFNYESFCKNIQNKNMVFSDCIGKGQEEIEQILDDMTIKPDVVFIDHLNAIRTGGFNAKAEIDQYILTLNALAKKHRFALMLCCQLNRDNQKDDDKTPQLHELKGSGNLEEAADIVLMLHWPWKYKKKDDTKLTKSEYIVILGKNRNGPTGYLELKFKPDMYQFTDNYVKPPDAHWSES